MSIFYMVGLRSH